MTREQAKSKIRMSVTVNKDHIKSLEKADEIIDQIFNELEALQSRSCEGCKREAEDMQDPHCAFCSRVCNDNYEAKEQL